MRFTSDRSQLLMGFSCRVLRPEFANAPACARMYWAFGVLAKYATVAPPVFLSAVTSVLVPGTPVGLKMARSPALSPFRLVSVALCTSPHSPVSYVYVGAIS